MREMVVISDSSALIALADIGELDILKNLYGNILITDIVRKEIHADLPDWISVTKEYDQSNLELLSLELDRGEASSIALALKNPACRLIIDERRGRKVAKNLGIKVVGLIGIILKAKEEGQINSGKKILENLELHGFWLSAKLKIQLLEKLRE